MPDEEPRLSDGVPMDAELRDRLRKLCTVKEGDAYALSLAGIGYDNVALLLGISKSTARDRIRRAERKLNEGRKAA